MIPDIENPKEAKSVYPGKPARHAYADPDLRRNVSARISLRGLRRLIWVDTLRRGHNVGFLAGRLTCTSGYSLCADATRPNISRRISFSFIFSD